MASDLKTLAERTYKEQDFHDKTAKYDYCRPFTMESRPYRELFDQTYPGQSKMIADFRMPNKTGLAAMGTTLSSRLLSNFGDNRK